MLVKLVAGPRVPVAGGGARPDRFHFFSLGLCSLSFCAALGWRLAGRLDGRGEGCGCAVHPAVRSGQCRAGAARGAPRGPGRRPCVLGCEGRARKEVCQSTDLCTELRIP